MYKFKKHLSLTLFFAFFQLISCTGMQSPDSLEAMRSAKNLRQQDRSEDQIQFDRSLVNRETKDCNCDKSNDEHQHDSHQDHEGEDPSIEQIDGWYSKVNEQVVKNFEDQDLRQIIIWRANEKVWARAVQIKDNAMSFLVCTAHTDHIDCSTIDKDQVPDIPKFQNKEDA